MGNSIVASCPCPGHGKGRGDKNPSLSVSPGDDGRALVRCQGGCATEDVVDALGLRMSDLMPGPNGSGHAAPQPSAPLISVADLARGKSLPETFLRSLGLEDKPALGGVVIPYRLVDGSRAPRQRLRTALRAGDGSKWLPGEGSPVPYGLDRLADAKDWGFVVLVEGETDCWALWLAGFPALGIPGASMSKVIDRSYLEGVNRVFVWREPDQGGDTFAEKIPARLKEIGFAGEVREIRGAELGAKDPLDLYQRDPGGFDQAFRKALETPIQATGSAIVVLENMKARTVLDLLNDTTLTEPEPVLDGIFGLGELMVLGGPPKAMKSWTAKCIGLSLASGNPWLGFNVPRPYRVVYLSAEGREARLRARFQTLVGFTPIEEDGLARMAYVSTMGRLKLDTEAGERTFLRLVEPFEVVIIDPYYRFQAEGSENSHEDQRRLQDLLDRVKDTGKAVIVIHHIRKPTLVDAGISELRGAGLDGFTDSAVILARKKEDKDDRFVMRFDVRNYEPVQDMELSRKGVVLEPAETMIANSKVKPWDVAAVLEELGELSGTRLAAQIRDLHKVSTQSAERAISAATKLNKISWKVGPGRGRPRVYFIQKEGKEGDE